MALGPLWLITKEGENIEAGTADSFSSPEKSQPKKKIVAAVDSFDEKVLRRLLYNFSATHKQRPTLTESYPAFARIGLRENPGKNLNQVTCPDRDWNPGHLLSRPDAVTVTPQHFHSDRDVQTTVTHWFRSQAADFYDTEIQMLILRTESYPAFAHIGLRENPGKNRNQVTCPDRDSNPGHLVSRPDALTVTPQLVQLPRFLHESLSSVRPVYVIDVYKLTPSNGPKERSRRARDLTVASDNLSAIEFRPGDFFFNVEPVIRNEATHRKIVFRVGILA
ncbi:hypothetical protein ANN_26475 [Periplaneta americana]|uniref:Uncharacterized protein n=1 Tax=Periplaneta americana TaxID=6978 RepID=A0ABQ8RYG7_PERAM|nr:hypothetical protein ANN_26475 [Periplaneta americana]